MTNATINNNQINVSNIAVATSVLVAPAFTRMSIEDAEYPTRILAQFGEYSPVLYVAGNAELLQTEMECVLSFKYSSKDSRISAKKLVNLIAQGHADAEHAVPTILLASDQGIDQGIIRTQGEDAGEVLFEGLLNIAMDAGANVVLFKAGKLDAAQFTAYDQNRICIVSTVNPEAFSGEKGSIASSHARNACVSVLAHRFFAVEIAANGGVADILVDARINKAEVFTFVIKEGTVPTRNGSMKVDLANLDFIMYKGATKIVSAQQVLDLF